MNLAADKFPQVGHRKASNENVFQTDWINKKKLYLIHNDDGSVTAKVVTRNFMQRLGELVKAKPAKETKETDLERDYTLLEEKTFFDVKIARFQKEKLQLQQLIKKNASIQTLLEQIERDFKSPLKPAQFQTSFPSFQFENPDFDITDDVPTPSKSASPQRPIILTAKEITNQHERLQGLKAQLENLLVVIEEQNKSKELRAYETLNHSIQRIEGFIHTTFKEIGALEQRLANPEISFEEFLAAAKGIDKQQSVWSHETYAIKQAFQEDRLIRQEMLSFEKELIPFSTAVKEAWMKHKKEWLEEFAPKKLASSMDMEPRRQKMKEICEAIRQQCLDELNQTITNEQQQLKQAQLKSITASVSPEKLQALNLFKKTALNSRLLVWKRLETAEPAVSIRTLAARQKEIKKEKHHDLIWMKWLNEIPTEPGYLSRSLSSIRHPIETVSRLLKKEISSELQKQESFDEVSFSYLQQALARIEKAQEEASDASVTNNIKAGINPAIAQKKLALHQEFLDFLIETRHLRAQDCVTQLKKNHSELFNPNTHPQILTVAHATILNIVNQLTTGTPRQGIDAEWKQGRLSAAAHVETLKHLETLQRDYQKYSALIQTNREKLGSLTGQEKLDAVAALDIFSESLATLDIGSSLEEINEKVLKTYSESVSHLIDHIHGIFHREQEKMVLKGHIGKDIDRSIHFFDSLLSQVGEIERFYSYEFLEIKQLLNEKKSAILQLKTKNTLPHTRWFWYFEFKMPENIEELSASELSHYRERVQQEIFEQTGHSLSLHISPLANALKELQKEHQELENHARTLTATFKFNPSTGFSNIPQYLRATHHNHTLKTIKERQLSQIKSEKSLSAMRKRVQEDTKTLKHLSELSKNAKALSLGKQIAQLEDNPVEQNKAKQTFIEMLTTEMSAHSTEMNEKLNHLVSTPAIYDETIDFIHETKGDLLLKVDSLPESLKAHTTAWFPIGSGAKFTPPAITVEGLSLSDLKQYKAYIRETIETGTIRMSSIHDAYQQAKEADRILQQKIHAAKKQLDVLFRSDQLLTKKALEGVITSIEEERAQEPDITQLGFVAIATRAVKNSFSSILATINDYKSHIGKLSSTLDSATKEAAKITLTIPQQLEQHPDEETMIALRERFYDKTLPFLNAAHQALDSYRKDNFDIFAMYVPRESTMYQRADDILEAQQKILRDFHTAYTPLSQIEIRKDHPEENSWWMPAGGLSTAHFMTILGSALLLGGNIAPSSNWINPLSIGKIALPSLAVLGIHLRSQKEGTKLPDTKKKSKEESFASTAAYYATALAAGYLATKQIALPLLGALGLRQLTSVEQRAKIVSYAKYGSLVGAAYYTSSLAAAIEMPGYPCLPAPAFTTANFAVALGGLASTLLPSAQQWLTKQFNGARSTSLAVLPPKKMEKYARDVKRLEHVLLDNTALTIDTKYSIETIAIAHNKYEQSKKDALSRVALLKAKDHHVEAYQLENTIYLTSIEVEKHKIGKGEFWRTPVSSPEGIEALLETFKAVTKELDAGVDKWIVTKAPSPFTEQLEILIDYKANHTSRSQAFEGMLTAEAVQEPNLAKAIDALKSKIITSIDSKHSDYHAELHQLKQSLNELFTKYSIQAPTKRQVDKILQKEIDAFSRPQDTKFVTSEGTLWNTEKTVEEMNPEEIIKHRPEIISKEFIDESKKRIKAVFSYEEILTGHNAYKDAVDLAEQAKIELEQEQRISHAGKLNDELFEISEAVKSRAKISVYTGHELEQLGVFLEKQARTLRLKQADILAHHKISPSEQIDQLHPDGPYVEKLVTSLRKEIETNLADKKKKIVEYTGNVQKVFESLECPKAWLKSIKDKLKDVQKGMEKAVEPLEMPSQGALGRLSNGWLGTSKSKITLAKMSMLQLGTVHKNLKTASAPIEDTVEAYHLSRLQTQYDYYQSQITAIDKQLKTSRKDKKNREIEQLETLKHTATTELHAHFDQAPANVPDAIDEFIGFLQKRTGELYDRLRKIQIEDPVSIATLMQAEAPHTPKYNMLKKDLKEEVKKKIDGKTKEIKAYSKHLDIIQKSLDNLEGVRAGIPEKWRQTLVKEVMDKQHVLADLAKGLPIVADGEVIDYKKFDALDAKELLTYETLIEQLVGKADKIFQHLESRAQLKKIATAITTWSSARVSMKYAASNVHESEDHKKWLSHCLESNDHKIAAVCKDLVHLSDTDTLLKMLDQTEASLTFAYKNKGFRITDNTSDPWSLLFHKEEANKNPYEKMQPLAPYIEHILSRQISLDGHDPQHQKTVRCLTDVITDSIAEITNKLNGAEQKKAIVAKDAQVNAPALQAWQTTIHSLTENIATLGSLKREFMFPDAAGVEKPLLVSKISTFKALLAYSQKIHTTLSQSFDAYNQTNDAQLVPMTLFAINNKGQNGSDDIDDDFDIPAGPAGLGGPDEEKRDRDNDDGGPGKPQQPGNQAGPAGPDFKNFHAQGGGQIPPQPHPGVFQAGPAPGPMHAAAPAAKPSTEALKAALDQLKAKVDQLHTELRLSPSLKKLDISKMTLQLFNKIPDWEKVEFHEQIPDLKKEEFNEAFATVQREAASISASLRRFIGEPVEAKDGGVVKAGNNYPSSSKLRDLIKEATEEPPKEFTIQRIIEGYDQLLFVQIKKEESICTTVVREQKVAINTFFSELKSSVQRLKDFISQKEQSGWIHMMNNNPHVPFKNVQDVIELIYNQNVSFLDTVNLKVEYLDGFEGNIRTRLDKLRTVKEAIFNLSQTVSTTFSQIKGIPPKQIKNSAHLKAAIHEALHALDKQSLKIKTKNDLIDFSGIVNTTHQEIKNLILKASKGHLVYAPSESISKIEAEFNHDDFERAVKEVGDEYEKLTAIVTNNCSALLKKDFQRRTNHVKGFLTLKQKSEIDHAKRLLKKDQEILKVFEIELPDDTAEAHVKLLAKLPKPYLYIDAYSAAKEDLKKSLEAFKKNCKDIVAFDVLRQEAKQILAKNNAYQTRFKEAQAAASNPKKCGPLHQIREAANHPGVLTEKSKNELLSQISQWGMRKLISVQEKHYPTADSLKDVFNALYEPLKKLADIIEKELIFHAIKINDIKKCDLAKMDFDSINKWVADVLETEEGINTLIQDLKLGSQFYLESKELIPDITKRLLICLSKIGRNDLHKQLENELDIFNTTIEKLILLLQETKDFSYFWRQGNKALEKLESSQAYLEAEKAMPQGQKSQRAPKPKAQKQASQAPCPYDILGFKGKNATAEEIKKQIQKLSMKWHPDKGDRNDAIDQENRTERIKEINWAKEEFIKRGIINK